MKHKHTECGEACLISTIKSVVILQIKLNIIKLIGACIIGNSIGNLLGISYILIFFIFITYLHVLGSPFCNKKLKINSLLKPSTSFSHQKKIYEKKISRQLFVMRKICFIYVIKTCNLLLWSEVLKCVMWQSPF